MINFKDDILMQLSKTNIIKSITNKLLIKYDFNKNILVINNIINKNKSKNFNDNLEINYLINKQQYLIKYYKFKYYLKNLQKLKKFYKFILLVPRYFDYWIDRYFYYYYNYKLRLRNRFLKYLKKKQTEKNILNMNIDIKEILNYKFKTIVYETNNYFIKKKVLKNIKVLKNKRIKTKRSKKFINFNKKKNLKI